MSRVQFVEHEGRRILHIDFSGALPQQSLEVIEEAKRVIAAQPRGSLLTLTDLTDLVATDEVVTALCAYCAHNRPYVRAAALLGAGGARRLAVNAVRVRAERQWTPFEDAQQARDWLVSCA